MCRDEFGERINVEEEEEVGEGDEEEEGEEEEETDRDEWALSTGIRNVTGPLLYLLVDLVFKSKYIV